MNYRMRRQGEDLGVFSLEELRRRREGGEVTGSEYVQEEGRSDWQPLDLVLQQGYRVVPPPLPSSVSKARMNPALVWSLVGGGVFLLICFVTAVIFVAIGFERGLQSAIRSSRTQRGPGASSSEGVAAARKPVTWTTNTLTGRDFDKRARAFRIQLWLGGYEKHGRQNPARDAEVEQFIRVWIDRTYNGPEATNALSLEDQGTRLANDPKCTDPLVLTVAAENSVEIFEATHRYERALNAFPDSHYAAYPRLYASVRITRFLDDHPDRIAALDTASLKLLESCFADGSFTPGDQQEIGEIFVNGWGNRFFERNASAICRIVRQEFLGIAQFRIPLRLE